jgi:hypothetical protein
MNNNIVYLAVGAIVVLGGGYWYFSSSNAGDTMAGDIMQGDSRMQNVGSTFAAILAGGQNVQCDYSFSDGTNQSSGRVYVADGGERLRGDFTITAPTTMEAHMIRDGGHNYIWSSMMEGQGMKMTVTAENRNTLFDTDEAGIPDDVNYNCAPWSVDASVFALPTGVEFMDMSAQMEQLKNMMPAGAGASGSGSADVKAMQCAACDQAPGEAREQCRVALGCE